MERARFIHREGDDEVMMIQLAAGWQRPREEDGEMMSLMQGTWPTRVMVDDNFQKVLRDLQHELERCTEDVAAIRAQQLGRRLLARRTGTHGPEGHGHGRVAQFGLRRRSYPDYLQTFTGP